MIQLHQVSKVYPERGEALRQVSLQIDRGEMAFLTGPSGAGKSTLLKIIALIERHTRGQVVVDGKNLERIGRRALPYYRRHIGFIFQDHRLLTGRTVFDNVALPLVVAGVSRTETERRVRAALDKVGLLAMERRHPRALSSGEQQRVGIARAVVHRPALLLADEPTGNLDPELSLEIMKLFEQFNRVGVTVLIATHDRMLIRSMPHRIIRLREGRVEDSGSQVAS